MSIQSLIGCAVHQRIALMVSQLNATSKPRFSTPCYFAAENHSEGLLLSASWQWAGKHLPANTFFWGDDVPAEGSLAHSGCSSGLDTKDCHLCDVMNAATFNSAQGQFLSSHLFSCLQFLFSSSDNKVSKTDIYPVVTEYTLTQDFKCSSWGSVNLEDSPFHTALKWSFNWVLFSKKRD